MKLRLDLRLSQKLIMTPQLQQAIKLLQLSRLELQQTLTQHLMENPLLEEVQADLEEGEAPTLEESGQDKKEVGPSEGGAEEPQAESTDPPEDLSPTGWEDYFDSDRRAGDVEYPSASQDEFPSYDQTLTKPTSLEDHLLWQLALSGLIGREKSIGQMIIGNLDDDGYLRTPLNEIATEASASVEEVESVLKHVQTFDPAGVGARGSGFARMPVDPTEPPRPRPDRGSRTESGSLGGLARGVDREQSPQGSREKTVRADRQGTGRHGRGRL